MMPFIYLQPLVIAVLAATLPLLLSTGQNLEYEYSILTALLFLIFISLSKLLFKTRPLSVQQHSLVVVSSILVTFIPGAILFLTEQCPCSDRGWLFWHSFHVIPIGLLAFSLGDFLSFIKYRSRALTATVVFFAVVTYQFLLVIGETYLAGMAKSHGLIYGFLHGPIYDSLIIADDGTIKRQYFYGLISLAAFFGALEVRSVLAKRKQVFSALSAVMCVFAICFTISLDTYSSYPRSRQDLSYVLKTSATTKQAVFHYDSQKTSTKDFEEIKSQTIFHIKDLGEILKIQLNSPIHIYLYPDHETKKKAFGGHYTDVTDVRTPAIHITPRNFPHPTLRHELVHALLSRQGIAGLGFHPNMALTEGLAVAFDNAKRSIPLHQAAGYLIAENKIRDVKVLFSPLFWLESGSRSYAVAGSLFKYLAEAKGPESVLKLYSGSSWESVFGAESSTILEDWSNYVKSFYDRDTHELYSRGIFRSKGILFEKCPHTKASLRHDGDNLQLFHPSRYIGKKNRIKYLVENFPTEKSYVLASIKESQDTSITNQLEHFLKDGLSSLEDVQATLLLADKYVEAGQKDLAIKTLLALRNFVEHKNIGNFLASELSSRLRLLENRHPDNMIWYSVFTGKTRADSPPRSGAPWEFFNAYLTATHQALGLKELFDLLIPETVDTPSRVVWHNNLFRLAYKNDLYEIAKSQLEAMKRLEPARQHESTEMLKKYLSFKEQESN